MRAAVCVLLVYPACAGIDPAFQPFFLHVPPFTPHARGSTLYISCGPKSQTVYPACAGIDPKLLPRPSKSMGLPRMRGDRPAMSRLGLPGSWFTPHARGSTQHMHPTILEVFVYPACAGIDLYAGSTATVICSLPRMRGDRPQSVELRLVDTEFTPHARGSTFHQVQDGFFRRVYPACAGIDPSQCGIYEISKSLPRMRGDRPIVIICWRSRFWFTPHARGSTIPKNRPPNNQTVYPACAGIDL